MKLATRIIAVSLATVILMTAAGSVFTVLSAYEEFEIQQGEVAQSIAATMSNLLTDAWKKNGFAGVQQLIREDGHLGLRMRWVWFEKETFPDARPHLPLHRWPSTQEVVSTITIDKSGQRYMHTYVPVTLAPGRHGGLEFTRSLAPLERQTWRAILIALSMIGAFAVVSVGIAYGTGVAWIGRPLQALIAKTQRISQGDFEDPLQFKRNDELGKLAAAINLMCAQLSEQQAAIQQEMAQRLAALEQLRHADRLTSVGRLAAGIAHEIGTPLNVISGRASLIATGQLSFDQVHASTGAIKAETERITNIVRQLLHFARRQPPHRAVTDLHELAMQTIDLLRQLADKHRVRIDILPSRGNVAASVDPSQLQQVLTNILVNAFYAMPEGGTVRIEVTGESDAAASDGFVRISISDNGTGIAKDDLGQIFEPFFTTKDVGQGTGLGLSIAHGIIQEHGGRIEVASEVGHGTCFTIRIPTEQLA